MDGTTAEIRVDPGRVARGLAALVTVLVAASVIGQMYVRSGGTGALALVAGKMNLDAELTVPAYVSSALLLAAALLLAVTAVATRSGWRSHWGVLSVLFAGLSVDEALGFHEKLVEPVRSVLDVGGALHFAWVIPGAIFVAVVGLSFVPFLLRRPPWLRRLMVLAGALYVGGALGLEFVGGALAFEGLDDSWAYVVSGTVEEAAELAGVSVFLYALLRNLEHLGGQLSVRVVGRG